MQVATFLAYLAAAALFIVGIRRLRKPETARSGNTIAAVGMTVALVATLYHCLNHACFKSLLFLATGSVLHATRERSLGKLGGLAGADQRCNELAVASQLGGSFRAWLLVDGQSLAARFPEWEIDQRKYDEPSSDWAWEIVRAFARAGRS